MVMNNHEAKHAPKVPNIEASPFELPIPSSVKRKREKVSCTQHALVRYGFANGPTINLLTAAKPLGSHTYKLN